jgi:hypothetical protein
MKRDLRTVVVAGAALALLASAGARPQPAPPLSAATQPPAAEPPAPAQPSPDAGAATCEAASLAWLVGKPKSAIPVPVNPSLRRVYCSTCLVTQDYLPGRTDIVFDSETGAVTQVKCG